MEVIYGVVWLIGRYTSFVNTTKNPIFVLGNKSKAAKRNWIDIADVIHSEVVGLCGFFFGMAAVSVTCVELG